MTLAWRVTAIVAGLVVIAWFGFEVGRSGGDVAVQQYHGPSTLSRGTIAGKRIDRNAWSLDYDTVEITPDGSEAHIAHVRDGRIHRAGRPDVTMQADDVTVNQFTNDFVVGGNVRFVEHHADGTTRTFVTTGAHYLGTSRVLTLDHPATITDGAATVTVASMTINFQTGDAALGRIVGTKPGSAH